ncbi:MAG: hypothetical protein M3Y57_12930 [Acidobacteriota bacterium]|nr:hypothetical protein [Acidobacteriota bacterium]
MKLLLDENMPHTLRYHLTHHETVTAAYAGYAGLKNGKLLDAAENGGFDALITGDKTLHHEQNMRGRKIALVSLSAVSWPVIEPYVAKIVAAVDAATPGSFAAVECGPFVRPRTKPS